MRKNHLVVPGIILAVSAAGVLAARKSPEQVRTQWEYGVYRVGGQYQYEWQDADGRIYAPNQKAFLEKMGLQSIAIKLQSITDAPSYALEYVLEAEFLNQLGLQGWELSFVIDRGPAGIVNRAFWFKRPK